MTSWQAVISTATQSLQSPGRLGLDPAQNSHNGSPKSSPPAFTSILRPLGSHAASAWRWLERKRTQQLAARRMRVAETIQLGEKRFVSILQVDGAQFLIGGAAGNVSLLAILSDGQATGTPGIADVIAAAEVTR